MSQKILNKSTNGKVYICSSCDKVHIEFNNLLFSFDKEEYKYFRNCLIQVNGIHYEKVNRGLSYERKIIVPVGHKNVTMLLNNSELTELKQLLSRSLNQIEHNIFISVSEIGLELSSN